MSEVKAEEEEDMNCDQEGYTNGSFSLLYTLYGHTRSVACVAFSPDGEHIASAGADQNIQIYTTRTGRLMHTLQGHGKGVNAVCWTQDSKYVASASDDKNVYLWDVEQMRIVRTFSGHTSYVFCIACHPQSTLLVSGGFDETIRLWDIQRGTCHRVISAHSEAVTDVDFSQDGSMIASSSYDGLIRLWDTSAGHCLRTLQHEDHAPVVSVRFSPSSLQLLAMSLDSGIRLWDLANARVLKTYTGHNATKHAGNAVFAFLPKDGLPRTLIVGCSEDRMIYIWDLQTKKILGKLHGHRDTISYVAYSPLHLSSKILPYDFGCIARDQRVAKAGMASVRRSQGVRPGRAISASGGQSMHRTASRVVSSGQADSRRSHEANMKVVVRVRSTAAEDQGVLQTIGPRGSELAISLDRPTTSLSAPTLGTQPGSSRNKKYTFDHVFSSEADQGMVYQDVVSNVLEEVLLGYNCTIFAYGQTGTGKTYTMEGDLTSYLGTFATGAGIIPRTLFRLFHVLNSRSEEFSVHMSFVELYNEELRDLLSADSPTPLQNGGLRMYEDKNKGVVLHGLEEVPLTSAEHGLRLLRQGSQKRHIASTRCNESSSRSHCVFTLHVHVKEKGARGEEVMRTGKLNLVDLAGSENIGRSGAENKRAREAGMINQSLLTLGRVINALVDGSSHVPYRESRLTRLLQDSLGGRTKTCIIATVSDERENLEETLSTLDYASRAKSIKNRPEINQRMARAALIREYVTEIDRLRMDLVATREKNGVYVDADNWQTIESDRAVQTKTIDELRRANEVAQSKLRSMQEQLEQNTQVLTRRDAEWTEAETRHEARIAELELSLQQITQLSTALQQETTLHRARARNEQRLFDLANTLHRTAQASRSDRDALHAKLQLRAESEKEARASLALFYEQIEGVHQSVQREADASRCEHAALRKAVQAEFDELGQLLQSAPNLPPKVSMAIQEVFKQLHNEHHTSIEVLRSQLTEAHSQHAEAVHSAAALIHHVDERIHVLGQHTQALYRSMQEAAESELQQKLDANESLKQSLHIEKEYSRQLRQHILASLDSYEAERNRHFDNLTNAATLDLQALQDKPTESRIDGGQHFKSLETERKAIAANVKWKAPEMQSVDSFLQLHSDRYLDVMARRADSLQDKVQHETLNTLRNVSSISQNAMAKTSRKVDVNLEQTAGAEDARMLDTVRSLDTLRESYTPFLQPTFLAGASTATFQRHNLVTTPLSAHLIPKDRDAGLAYIADTSLVEPSIAAPLQDRENGVSPIRRRLEVLPAKFST
ncbi:Kinesin- motor protein [Malassezia psittaci]|uniref:Kinesin- motor protein n=1 Tax=Malassezia psittaci TaxID=1821823 RepID=A0AAF0JDK5_9BASI|nr:Kinesin- motor protein [Malassezia psittaci]